MAIKKIFISLAILLCIVALGAIVVSVIAVMPWLASVPITTGLYVLIYIEVDSYFTDKENK